MKLMLDVDMVLALCFAFAVASPTHAAPARPLDIANAYANARSLLTASQVTQAAYAPVFESRGGQADYYAASQCMKKYLADQEDEASGAVGEVDEKIARLCRERFAADEKEVRLCQGAADAAQRFMRVVMLTQKKGIDAVDISTLSTEIASSTLTNTLPDQCRLDNLLAGALNEKRPSCWFKE